MLALGNNLQRIEEFYLEAGWYSDGIGGSDYYVPYAFHFYGLIYALMGGTGTRRALQGARRCLPAISFTGLPRRAAVPYGAT